MLERFREFGHTSPISSSIFKMIFAAVAAFIFFVCFIMPPITVRDIYSKSDYVLPGGSFTLVTESYKNPLTSFLCAEKSVTLNSKLLFGEFQLPLLPTPEPYGNKKPGLINQITIEHKAPENAREGSILIVNKVYIYSCLGRERQVTTPLVRIKVGQPAGTLPKIGNSNPLPYIQDRTDFGFQYEQRSLK